MGKSRKRGRCVKKNQNITTEPEEFVKAPHSFVIHKGLPGEHILELTRDFRKVMEPFTATSLKERKKNAVKDFVSVAGLLHVSHLCIFTRTEIGMYLKLARLPRGPTLTLKIHNFSLAKDVVSSLKKQFVLERAFKHSPLIILNGFGCEGMQFKLMVTMFQSMFPTINLTKVDLNDIRRCVLLNYNQESKLIEFRHYAIKIVPVGISKGVKKVIQGKVPNLSKCEDISEFFTKSGIMSESEFEDDPTNHVTLPQKLISRGNIELGKSAIRLIELGPRLNLQLIKVEEGLLDGEVLYHDLVHKTEEEKADIQSHRESKKKLKAKRKRIQEENKKKKEDLKQDAKEKSLKGMDRHKTETEKPAEVPDDDAAYYREEVGEEPDKELFSHTPNRLKRPHKNFSYQNKKQKLNDGASKSFNKEKRKPKRQEKTNSKQRDFRPIGGRKV